MKSYIKKGDVLIIVVLTVMSLCLLLKNFAYNDGERYARVYEDGQLVYTIDLNEKQEYIIEIKGGELHVDNGTVEYKNSDCPDKTCEGFGKLSRIGDTASCVPNRTVVIVVGADDDQPDVITY